MLLYVLLMHSGLPYIKGPYKSKEARDRAFERLRTYRGKNKFDAGQARDTSILNVHDDGRLELIRRR